MTKNNLLFKKAKELNLPKGGYAIFGSGPMGVRGLKECHDLDIIVKEGIFEKYKNLKNWQSKKSNNSYYLDNNEGLELWKDWGPGKWNIAQLIKDAEIIDDLPFVRLNSVLEWKKMNGREKDLKDIKLIEDFLLTC